MDYADPPPASELSMAAKEALSEETPSSLVSHTASCHSPLAIKVGLPEREPLLSPLSTPSPSIRIDDSMSDISALSPYTPLMSMSPTGDTPQQSPAPESDARSGLSLSTSALSLNSSTQSPSGSVSRASYRAKAKGLQFNLSSLSSNSGMPLFSPVDAFRQQEVFPLPSPMARDLRRCVEADALEVDITSPNDDNRSEFDTIERKTTQPESSCLGLDLGLPASSPSIDSYIGYGYKGHNEKETIGVDRESGVEEFRAQIMQATLAQPANAELVSSPEKPHGRRLDPTRGREDHLKGPGKKSPKRNIPLPKPHLKLPFISFSPTTQGSVTYTPGTPSQPTTPTSSKSVDTHYGTRKNGSPISPSYGRYSGAECLSPSPKHKIAGRDAHTNQHAFDLMQARMQGCVRFPERFAPGYRLEAEFAQKYDLETELGSGGYGFVLSARHRITGETVAVKFIIRAQIPAHGLVKDYNNQIVPLEAVVLRLVHHPGVVEFRGLFKDSIFFYLVQELHGSPWSKNSKNQHKSDHESVTPVTQARVQHEAVSPYAPMQSSPLRKLTPSLSMPTVPTLGSPAYQELGPRQSLPLLGRPQMPRRASYDLFECIEQHERLSEAQARYIFAQVVETVWHLDSMGITHRDIKDENLVIDKDFKVKVIDFGSAVVRDVRQPPPMYTRFFGTVTFASPEILNEQPYAAPPAEVWTLGILLSFLVTGQSPFPTSDHAKYGVMCEPNGSIVVSPLCRDLIHKCLEHDPTLRLSVHQVREHPWLRGALDRA